MAVDGARERIAYLQGLAEGTELEETGTEGRMLFGILEVLEEIAQRVDEIGEDLEGLEVYIEEVDEALWALEGRYNGEVGPMNTDYDVDPNTIEWELTCPSCGERVYYVKEDDADVVEVLCPVCGEILWDLDNGFRTPEEAPADDIIARDPPKRRVPDRND